LDKKIEIDPRKLRNVAGGFATGITVVSVETNDKQIKGMTANSFLSVSLDPPLVLFSVQNEGTFLDHCHIGTSIGISILGDHQKFVSEQFAGLNSEDQAIEFIQKGNCKIILDSLGWYQTNIKEMITVGDHRLIICNILDLDRNELASPLLYYSGYKNIGKDLTA